LVVTKFRKEFVGLRLQVAALIVDDAVLLRALDATDEAGRDELVAVLELVALDDSDDRLLVVGELAIEAFIVLLELTARELELNALELALDVRELALEALLTTDET
jgi:hypothetical protein